MLEKRGRDVDRGYKVAATGEIELDGIGGQIGGIKQKTIGARKSHVDVFLVPVDGDNAKEREALRAWPADHPCEEFSTGVAGAGNAAAKSLDPAEFSAGSKLPENA